MEPVTIEVITYAPTAYYHCQHCEIAFQEMGIGERLRRQEAAESLPDDLSAEFQELSDWVHATLVRHGGAVRVRVVDAASVEGVLESMRHRVYRYPAFIVADSDKRIGADYSALDELVERRISAQPPRGDGGSRKEGSVAT